MPIIVNVADLIALITASATAITGVIVAIRYSRCKLINCFGVKCERELVEAPPTVVQS
tara:strand:- start:3444 stop:3617 length:174 start_codon:yes stop_codon:yes gene_type:complete